MNIKDLPQGSYKIINKGQVTPTTEVQDIPEPIDSTVSQQESAKKELGGFWNRVKMSFGGEKERAKQQELEAAAGKKGFQWSDIPGDVADVVGGALPLVGGILGGTFATPIVGGAAGAAINTNGYTLTTLVAGTQYGSTL